MRRPLLGVLGVAVLVALPPVRALLLRGWVSATKSRVVTVRAVR
jgi:hypothetical protein